MESVEYIGDGTYRCLECGREYDPMEGHSAFDDAVQCSDDCPKNSQND